MNILIKNGNIIDGSGSPGYTADILIKDNKIETIGKNLETKGYDIIDASNRVVAPGFIDMHSHADLSILEVNGAEAMVRQGITTAIVSVCGLGLAPANKIVRTYYNLLVTKLLSTSEMQLYNTLPELMDAIIKKGISINLAFFVPHGNIRGYVLGMEERAATTEEIEKMKDLIKQGMEAGAFGLSTGLIYPPGEKTHTDELIEICKALNEYDGIYNSHVRNEGRNILGEGIGELIQIAKGAQVKAHISHLKVGGFSAKKLPPKIIDLIKKARAEGLFLHADLYPYEEVPFFLSASVLKPWVFDDFEGNLTNPDTRKEILEDIFQYFYDQMKELPLYARIFTRILPKAVIKKVVVSYIKKRIRVLRVLHNHHVEGKYLGEALEILYPERKFLDAMLDFVRDEESYITFCYKFMNEERSTISFFQEDFVCIGSDGFIVSEGSTHPRVYGTFPRILGEYVRERQLVSLEEGIRKMTGLTASILALTDRGLVKEGYKADLVIFDPVTIRDTSTYEDSYQFPVGIDYVIVNGEITVAEGEYLGTLNGQIIKHKQKD